MNIEQMTENEIINYLINERNYLVLKGYGQKDMERMYELDFSEDYDENDDWTTFSDCATDYWNDVLRKETMDAIVEERKNDKLNFEN